MNESKMAHIEKTFDLPAGGGVQFHTVGQHLQIIRDRPIR